MAKAKPITVTNWISVDGAEPVRMDSLPEEKQKEYGERLNHKMLTALGYVPVGEVVNKK